jgi:hypothetical protein
VIDGNRRPVCAAAGEVTASVSVSEVKKHVNFTEASNRSV